MNIALVSVLIDQKIALHDAMVSKMQIEHMIENRQLPKEVNPKDIMSEIDGKIKEFEQNIANTVNQLQKKDG